MAYSYRSATIGSSAAARRAGQMPKNRPTAALKTKASMIASGEMSVFHCASLEISSAPSEPSSTPISPPARHSTSASTRNWNMILKRVAPSALRTLFREDADDLECDPADEDLLADHRVAVRVEHLRDSRSEDRDPAPRCIIPRGEHAADRDGVIMDGHVRGRRAHDRHVDVLVAQLDLQVVAQLRHDGAQVAGVVHE